MAWQAAVKNMRCGAHRGISVAHLARKICRRQQAKMKSIKASAIRRHVMAAKRIGGSAAAAKA